MPLLSARSEDNSTWWDKELEDTAPRVGRFARLERALPRQGQSNRIWREEVVAQDHDDFFIGDLAVDESASAGQRTPIESLVERSLHGIAEEHPDIRRLADVLRGPAHELTRMTLATELREGEHRPDASDSQRPAMALDRKRKDEHVADKQVASRADECVGVGSSQWRVRNRSSPLMASPQTSRTKAQSWISNSRGKSACGKTNSSICGVIMERYSVQRGMVR